MENFNSSVTFYAKFEEAHPAGSAIKVSNLSDHKDLSKPLIAETYLPKSQMRLKVISKTKHTVQITVPLWLWDAKVEQEEERNQEFQSSTESELDQALTLFATK